MLDTRFPRPPGDVGHPGFFAGPVLRRVVPGAWPARVVASAAALRASGLLPAFAAALQHLELGGARALTTSCGFLVLLQSELQAVLRVPLVTSSLLQLPGLLDEQAQVGVLTISEQRLGAEHLLAAGVPAHRLPDVRVQGVDPGGEFATAILGNRPAMDLPRAHGEVVAAAIRLQHVAPSIRTVVLECTNMPPCAEAVQAATGLSVRHLGHSPALRPWAHPAPGH